MMRDASDGDISIHAPRVGSDGPGGPCCKDCQNFNPRSPCGERPAIARMLAAGSEFQSTLPVWGATLCVPQKWGVGLISIHAPRVGSDDSGIDRSALMEDFNPRSPCGERHQQAALMQQLTNIFQSTLPVWGATQACDTRNQVQNNFNPRSPCGERQKRRTQS